MKLLILGSTSKSSYKKHASKIQEIIFVSMIKGNIDKIALSNSCGTIDFILEVELVEPKHRAKKLYKKIQRLHNHGGENSLRQNK